jgi:hypothetical protein
MLSTSRHERLYRGLASTFIIVILGAQAATLGVTLVKPGWLYNRLYPIIDYPMYALAHYDGERVTGRWLLRGVLENGGEIDITEQSLHLSVWDFVGLTEPIVSGAPNAPETHRAIQELVAVVRAREPRAAEFKTLRIDSYPMRVTRHGPETIPSETVLSIPMS